MERDERRGLVLCGAMILLSGVAAWRDPNESSKVFTFWGAVFAVFWLTAPLAAIALVVRGWRRMGIWRVAGVVVGATGALAAMYLMGQRFGGWMGSPDPGFAEAALAQAACGAVVLLAVLLPSGATTS